MPTHLKMHFHRNAKLGLARRRALVLQIAAGGSMREAAATLNIFVAIVQRWLCRWRQASEADRRSRSCLFDREPSRAQSTSARPEAEHCHL